METTTYRCVHSWSLPNLTPQAIDRTIYHSTSSLLFPAGDESKFQLILFSDQCTNGKYLSAILRMINFDYHAHFTDRHRVQLKLKLSISDQQANESWHTSALSTRELTVSVDADHQLWPILRFISHQDLFRCCSTNNTTRRPLLFLLLPSHQRKNDRQLTLILEATILISGGLSSGLKSCQQEARSSSSSFAIFGSDLKDLLQAPLFSTRTTTAFQQINQQQREINGADDDADDDDDEVVYF